MIRNISRIFNFGALRHRAGFTFAMLIWAGAVGTGIIALTRYESTPGHAAVATRTWPVQSRIALSSDRPTLVMFLHPHCACSRATLEELNQALAKCPDGVATQIVFYKPVDQSIEWMNTDLWRTAKGIPGASVISDEGSELCLARAFGALTSGQTFLYDTHGTLLFSGGITGSRGHVGDNDGLDQLVAMIRNESNARIAAAHGPATAPVFGCVLEGNEDKTP